MVGYGLIVLAGLMMLVQSLRVSANTHDGAHALTAGIGLLPCPLTISVLGFAWAQSSAAMVGLVLLSLALGMPDSPLFVSEWWLAFTAFVGLNLLQSALTQWCLMETILRRLGVRPGC